MPPHAAGSQQRYGGRWTWDCNAPSNCCGPCQLLLSILNARFSPRLQPPYWWYGACQCSTDSCRRSVRTASAPFKLPPPLAACFIVQLLLVCLQSPRDPSKQDSAAASSSKQPLPALWSEVCPCPAMASPSIPEALHVLRARASASSATLRALKEQAIAQQQNHAPSGHTPSGEVLLRRRRSLLATPRGSTGRLPA